MINRNGANQYRKSMQTQLTHCPFGPDPIQRSRPRELIVAHSDRSATSTLPNECMYECTAIARKQRASSKLRKRSACSDDPKQVTASHLTHLVRWLGHAMHKFGVSWSNKRSQLVTCRWCQSDYLVQRNTSTGETRPVDQEAKGKRHKEREWKLLLSIFGGKQI